MDASSLDYSPVNQLHFMWVTGFLQSYNAATENEMALARQLHAERFSQNPSQMTPGEEGFQKTLTFIMAGEQPKEFFIPKRLQEAMSAAAIPPGLVAADNRISKKALHE